MPMRDLVVDLAVRYGFQVLGALVILAAGALIARWVGQLSDRWLIAREFQPPIRALSVRAVRLVVLLFACVIAMDRFGFQIAPLVAGIGVAGLGISFALQGVLSNIVAGLTIILTKPFLVGEYIEVAGVHGEVRTIELFSTTLIHTDRSLVVIPNRKIVGEILHNYGQVRQLHLTVTVATGTDLGRALACVHEVLKASGRILRQPVPVVGVRGVHDPAIAIGIDPWVAVPDFVAGEAEVYRAVLERFRAEGIALAVPQRELRMLGGGA